MLFADAVKKSWSLLLCCPEIQLNVYHPLNVLCFLGKVHQETAFESFRRKFGSCFENDPKCILRFNESKNFVPVSFYFQVKMGFQISDSQGDIWKPDAAFCSSFPEIRHYISWNHPVVWLSLSPAGTHERQNSDFDPRSASICSSTAQTNSKQL